MLVSDKHRYIFISIPKTGTTAIQSFLLENDNTSKLNRVEVEGNQIEVDEHIKAKDLKEIMGNEYDKYSIFTFIRDPYARSVSAYFFYKNGNTLRSHSYFRNIMASLNIYLTKLFPFSWWSVIKPQKKLSDYFFDDKNTLLIDMVGKTENMNDDLLTICNLIGIPLECVNVPLKNSSKHSSVEKYYLNNLHKKIYNIIMNKDIELYNIYVDKITTENYKFKTNK